jgi:nucleotide-binding universal stress UspA family protein
VRKEGGPVSYRNILFCTDFSESSRTALPVAIDLAKKYGAVLHVLHVYQEPGEFTEFEMPSEVKIEWVRVSKGLTLESEKRLNSIREEILREIGSASTHLAKGDPRAEISRYARDRKIDLIVLGSHGLTGWAHLMMGSTAERVVRESPCHVLVVKKPR